MYIVRKRVLVSNSNGLYKLENELIIIQFSSRNLQDFD